MAGTCLRELARLLAAPASASSAALCARLPACSSVLPRQERSSGAAAAVCSWLRLLQDCNVWLDRHGVGVDLPGHASVRATDPVAPGSPQWDFVVCARAKLAELVSAFARTMVWPSDANQHTPTLVLLQALKDCSSACLHSRCRASEVNPALTSAQARALQAGEAMDAAAAGLPAALGCLSVALLAALNPLGSRWATPGDASPQLNTVPALVAHMLGGSGAAALMACVREHGSWQDPGAQGAALLAIAAALLSLDRPAEADAAQQAMDAGELGDGVAALVPRAREDARKCLKEALAARGLSWFAGLLAAGFHGAPSAVKMAGVALLHQLCAHLVQYDGRSGRQPLLQVGTGVDPALENAGLDVGFVDSHSSARKRDGYEALLTLQALACTAQPALAADYVCAGGSLHWAASVAVSSGALDAPEDSSHAHPTQCNPTAVALASNGGYLRHALRAATDMAMLTAVYRLAAAVAGGVVAADSVAPAHVVWKLFDSNAVSEDIRFDAQVELASAMVERYSPERVLAQVEQHLDAATMGGRGMEVLEPLRDRAAAIRSGDYSSCAVDPSLAHMLQSMLALWAALARVPSTRTSLLARRVGPRRHGAMDALFQLLGLPLPLHTKAVILDALAAMAVDDSVAAAIWAGMYSSQLLPVTGGSGVTANAGIRADHINVELPNADFSYSAAYLRLVRALLARPAGMALAAKAAHAAKATHLNKMPAYLSFVVHDILLPMVQPRALSRRQAAARWTLVAQACAVLFEIIARYGVVAEPPNASELKAGEAVPGMPELDFLPDATLLALGAQGQQGGGSGYGLRARFMPARGGAGGGAQPPGVPSGDGPAPASLATATRSPAYTLLCDLCQGDKLLHALLQAICADGGAPALEAANASRALLGDCAVSHTPCPPSRVPEQHLLAAVQRETGAAAALDVADALAARSADVLGWRSRAALAALQVLDVACTIDAEFIRAIQAPAQRAMDVLRAPAARGEPAWADAAAVGPVLSASHPAALRRVTQLVADAPVFPDMYRWAVGGAGVQGLPAGSMNSSDSYLDPRAALLATRLVWRTLCEGAHAETHVEKFCRRLLFERQHVELGSGHDPHAAALALASAGGAVGPGTLDARLVASAGDRRGRMTFALGSGLGTQAGSVASYIHAPCAASVPSAGHTGIMLAMAGAVTPLQALSDQLCAWLELLAARQRGQDVLGAGGVAPVHLHGMDPERLLRDQLAADGPEEVASRLALTEALQLAIVGVAAGPDAGSGAAAPLLNYEALDLGAGTCMHRAVSRAFMGAGMLSSSDAALQAHSIRGNFERRWQLGSAGVDEYRPAPDSSALALPGLLLDCEALSCAAADSRRRDGQLLVLAALCERLVNDEALVRKPVRQQFLQTFINLPMPGVRAGPTPGVSHAQSAMLSVVLRALAGVAADANALLLKPVATAHACSILAALSKSKLAGPAVRSQLSRWSAELLAPMRQQPEQQQQQQQAPGPDAGAAPSHPGFFLQALATMPLATLRPWLMLQPCRANAEVTRLLFDYILPEAGNVPGMRSQSLRGALQGVVLPSLLGAPLEPSAAAVALSPSLQALLNPRPAVDGQHSQAVPEVIDAVQNTLFVMLDAVRTHVCAVYMHSSLRVATAQDNEAERTAMLRNTTRFTGFSGAVSLSLMASVARDMSSAAETALERLGQHALAGRAALTALVEGACLELVDAMPDPAKYLLTGGSRQAMPQLRAAVLALLGPSSDASAAGFSSATAGTGSALDALMACVPAREQPPERAPEWLAVATRLFHEAAEARGVALQGVTFADVLPGAPWRPAQFIPTARPEVNAVAHGLPSMLGSAAPGSQRQLYLFDLPLWLALLQAGLARGRLGPAELQALGQAPGEAARHAAACVEQAARACGWARGWNLYVHSAAAGVALLQALQRLSALLVPVLPSVVAALPQPLHRSLRLAAQTQLAAAPQSIVCLRESDAHAGPREPPSACVTAVAAVFQVMLAHITLAQAAPPARDDIVAVLQSAGASTVPIPLLLTGIAASSVQLCAGVLRDLLASYHSQLQPHVQVALCQYLVQQCLASGSAGVLAQDANTTLGGSSAAMRGHLMLALAHLLASAMRGAAPLHQLDADMPGELCARQPGLQPAAADCSTALQEIAHVLAPAMPALLATVLSDLLQAEVPVQSAAAVLLTRLVLLDVQAAADEQGTAPAWGVLSTVSTLLASGRAASQLAQVIAAATAFEVSLGIALAGSQVAPGAVSGAIEAAASAAGACGAGFACLARMPARAAWAAASGLLNALICLVAVLCESMPAALLRELHAARVFAACAQVSLRSAPECSLDPPASSQLQLHHAWRSTLGGSEAERLHNALDGALPAAAAAQAIDAVAGRLTALLRLATLLYQRSSAVAVALTAGNTIWAALQQPCEAIMSYVVAQRATLTGLRCAVAATRCSAAGLRAERAAQRSAGASSASAHDGLRGPILQLLRTFAAQPYWLASAAQRVGGAHSHLHLIVQSGGIGALPASVSDQLDCSVGALWWVRAAPITPSERLAAQMPAPPGSPAYVKSRFAHELLQAAELAQMWALRYLSVLSLGGAQQASAASPGSAFPAVHGNQPAGAPRVSSTNTIAASKLHYILQQAIQALPAMPAGSCVPMVLELAVTIWWKHAVLVSVGADDASRTFADTCLEQGGVRLLTVSPFAAELLRRLASLPANRHAGHA